MMIFPDGCRLQFPYGLTGDSLWRGWAALLPSLLDQVEGDLSQVSADGAYNSHGCHAAIAEHGTRDAILQEIRAKRLAGWKNESGYHWRSIAETENMMYRFTQLGDNLYSRRLERQVNEAHVL